MAAGFCILDSGLVTTKSVSTITAKNIGKFAICSLVFFLVGHNLAYGVPKGGYVGSFSIWTDSSDDRTAYSIRNYSLLFKGLVFSSPLNLHYF